MTIRLHRGDLPDLSRYTGAVAIDTETMGLYLGRDRLCVVQLSPGDGSADVVQIPPHATDAPNLKRLLTDVGSSRFFTSRGSISPCCATPLASCRSRFTAPRSPRGWPAPTPTSTGSRIWCARCSGTTSRSSNNCPTGAAAELSDAQVSYAASDVIYLHALKDRLDAMLAREGREGLAAACFRFCRTRARLDLAGFADD